MERREAIKGLVAAAGLGAVGGGVVVNADAAERLSRLDSKADMIRKCLQCDELLQENQRLRVENANLRSEEAAEPPFSHDDVRCILAMKILRERGFTMYGSSSSVPKSFFIIGSCPTMTTESYADPVDAIMEAERLYLAKCCTIPPAGWSCSREAGHDGPCAARAKEG